MPPGIAVAPPICPTCCRPVKLRRGIVGFLRRHPTIAVGGALLILMLLMAVFAPYLGTVDPTALAPARRTRAPSAEHWFGTDMLGRDLYSRVVYGARVSLTVGFSVAAFASVVGLAIGLFSGFVRWADAILMRVMDGLMSIPPILLAVALMALTRGSVGNVILAITIAEIPRVSRLVRGVVLSLREQPYVDAAVAAGTRTPMIILRHILPNTLAPMTVQATYICASAMIVEAILSFIGAGTPPIIPSWGNIMAEGRALWQVKPFIVFFPAAFLSVTVLAVNLLGDGLRDALDPRMARGCDADGLLEVANLQTHFRTPDGVNRAVDGVSFHVDEGETLAMVGESGCGKSVTAMSILRLIPEPPGKIAGSIRFQGKDLLKLLRSRDAQHPRQRHQHGLPGADDEPQPGAQRRPPDRRDAAPAPGPRQKGGRGARGGDAGARGHPGAAPARARISASAFGRHAPARDDRDRAGLQSEAPDRRRADHGAGRDHPGANPRPDEAISSAGSAPPSFSSPTTSVSWRRSQNA